MIYDQSIFRAYDVRGLYPSQMNEKVAYAAGQAFVHVMEAKRVAIGRDVRATGVSLQQAMIQGVIDAGAVALDIGVVSTEMLYFASGELDCDGGLSVTASHNPAEWNGFKCVGKGGVPLVKEGKLGELYDFIQSNRKIEQFEKGSVEKVDLLPLYVDYLKKFVPADLPTLKVVANPNFGPNGKVVDRLVEGLPLDIVRLNWEENGTFPKGTPDPMLLKNRREIMERVVQENAHFGAAWDADADRCFFYDEKGRWFNGYYISALLIKHFLGQEPGAAIIAERRLTQANIDAAKEGDGKIIYSRTGHGYIKKAMRDNHAIVGGEASGHYYFRDFFSCDNGLITFLTILGIFADEIKKGGTVSNLLDHYLEKYPISGELNYTTPRAKEIIELVREKYADSQQDMSDGLSLDYPEWHLSLRSSSNEPVLRMNIEARNQAELDARLHDMQELLTKEGAELRNDE